MKSIVQAALAAVIFSASFLTSAQAATLDGTWSLISGDDRVAIDIRWSDDQGDTTDSTLHPIDVSGLGIASALASGGQHVRFALHHEAGDYAMDGWIGNEKGGGTYVFTPNAAFFADLRAHGLTVDRPQDQLTFANLDITREYIADLANLGYHLGRNDLITFAALHIDRAYLSGLRTQGLHDVDTQNVIAMKALHVDGEYIQMLARAGYPNLSAHDYVSLKALHVDADYIKDLAGHGYTHLTVEQLIEYKAMHIQ